MDAKEIKMIWNGQELVFEDMPMIGIAGLAPNTPDEYGERLAKAWNLLHKLDSVSDDVIEKGNPYDENFSRSSEYRKLAWNHGAKWLREHLKK